MVPVRQLLSKIGLLHFPGQLPIRLSAHRPWIISSVFPVLAIIVVGLRYTYLQSPDTTNFRLDLANFAVVLVPFALSILFAFVPDMRSRHVAWQALTILIGVFFSWIVWKQQHLAADAAKRDQLEAIQAAVVQSNRHSDTKLGEVQSDITKQLGSLESDLSLSIGKVKPPPPTFARLQFTFYEQSSPPTINRSLRAKSDGSFDLEFSTKNVSIDSAAESGDIWMVLCDDCKYVSEPTGFEKISESAESTRHKSFQLLNHGVTLEPWKASIWLPEKYTSFEISFKYSCKTCGPGEQDMQRLTVSVLPPFSFATPVPKPKIKAKARPS